MSEDPARDGVNWFSFVGNNPMCFTEPFGLYRIYTGGGYSFDTEAETSTVSTDNITDNGDGSSTYSTTSTTTNSEGNIAHSSGSNTTVDSKDGSFLREDITAELDEDMSITVEATANIGNIDSKENAVNKKEIRRTQTFNTWPVAGTGPEDISDGFGYRDNPFNPAIQSMHWGIDIAAALGTLLVAPKIGVIVPSSKEQIFRVYGHTATIDHGDGTRSFAAHMSESLSLPTGTIVNTGNFIGRVGMTGMTTGPHTHFEFQICGNMKVNPLSFYKP